MGTTKKQVGFSDRHKELSKATEAALKKVRAKLVAETKAKNSYLVVTDEAGNIKKIPAKDL
ncbi:MAG: hypothetical protein JWR72_2162 [Flavisolibacter sp.]|jgi:hypothetical protein|nr:hypothetical protein [Flavisolibacter sp.]